MRLSLATAVGAAAAYIKNNAIPNIENESARNLAEGLCTAVEVGCTIAGLFGA